MRPPADTAMRNIRGQPGRVVQGAVGVDARHPSAHRRAVSSGPQRDRRVREDLVGHAQVDAVAQRPSRPAPASPRT